MNKLFITGNLTRDPEMRTVNGREGQVNVCDFTVAVNRRNSGAQNDADYFRVTAWRGMAENCQKYLAKGRKVAVTGPISCRTYTGNDGAVRASMEITAEDVEFLSPKPDGQQGGQSAPVYQNMPSGAGQAPVQQRMDVDSGFTVAEEDDDLPF